MYSEKVMDHFENPRNVGEIPDADGIGKVGNPTCGDLMYIYIKVEDDVLVDVKFKTFGCGAAIATSISVGLVSIIAIVQVYFFLKMHPYRLDFVKPLIAQVLTDMSPIFALNMCVVIFAIRP